MEEQLTCCCGNIRINGKGIESNQRLRLTPGETKILQTLPNHIIEAGNKGILISDMNLVTTKIIGQCSIEIICSKCYHSIISIINGNKAYCYLSNTSVRAKTRMRSPSRTERPLARCMPLQLRRFMQLKQDGMPTEGLFLHNDRLDGFNNIEKISSCIDDNDDDFLLMFSANEDVIIGSYESKWLPIDSC